VFGLIGHPLDIFPCDSIHYPDYRYYGSFGAIKANASASWTADLGVYFFGWMDGHWISVKKISNF